MFIDKMRGENFMFIDYLRSKKYSYLFLKLFSCKELFFGILFVCFICMKKKEMGMGDEQVFRQHNKKKSLRSLIKLKGF